jgi:DNA-binding NarL/FixJ family response regulator
LIAVSSGPQSEKTISVMVADENRMACQLLASSLERRRDFSVVGAAVSLAEACEAVKRAGPQVAIVSANLKDGPLSGFELLRNIRQTHPDTRVILLLDSSERNIVVDAFRAGARGVFCRSHSFKLLCKCIACVHEGQIWADSSQMQFVVESLAPQAPAEVVNAKGESLLTKREKEVVACVADGLSNREIAKQLKLSEHTVKNYLFRICDKVGTSGRVELVLYALSHGEFADLPASKAPVVSQALESPSLSRRKPARPAQTGTASSSNALAKKDPFGNLLTELFQ